VELEQELKEIAKNRLDFYILSDYYSVLLDYYAANKIPQNTLYTFSLQGFLPRETSADVVRQIESNYSALVEIQELTTQDDYPIMLKNNPFSGSLSNYTRDVRCSQYARNRSDSGFSSIHIFIFRYDVK